MLYVVGSAEENEVLLYRCGWEPAVVERDANCHTALSLRCETH